MKASFIHSSLVMHRLTKPVAFMRCPTNVQLLTIVKCLSVIKSSYTVVIKEIS